MFFVDHGTYFGVNSIHLSTLNYLDLTNLNSQLVVVLINYVKEAINCLYTWLLEDCVNKSNSQSHVNL